MLLRSYGHLDWVSALLYFFFYKECITIRAGDDKVDLARVKVVQRDVGACCGSLERA